MPIHSTHRFHRQLLLAVALFAAIGSAFATPTVSKQPGVVTVANGQPAAFTVEATGRGTVSCQWRHLGHPIAGATAAAFTITSVEQASAGFYDVEVHDNDGTIVSSPGLLCVESAVSSSSYRLDSSFAPLVTVTSSTYASPEVRSLECLPDGTVYVAGRFAMIAGKPRAGLARFDSSLVIDPAFAPEVLGDVNVVLVQPDGRVVIGGEFTHVAGVARRNLARLNADGTVDTSFDPGEGCDGSVRALVRQPDGRILVGGGFTTCGGVATKGIARVLANGAADLDFSVGAGCDREGVLGIALQTNGKIVISGTFINVAGSERWGLARLETNGCVDASFVVPQIYGGYVGAVVIQPDGKILGARPNSVDPISRFNVDGSLDETFVLDPLIDNHGGTAAIRLVAGGGIYVAGGLGSNTQSLHRYIFRLFADGALDPQFAPVVAPEGPVTCHSVLPDGRLLAGGFVKIGTQATSGFVRYASNGAVDAVVEGAFGIPGTVADVVPAPGGKWYIAGDFEHVNGVPRKRIARLNADGSLDLSFDPGSGFSGKTERVVVAGDGKIVVGGAFTAFDGRDCEGVVRLGVDGRFDAGFSVHTWSGSITSIARLCIQRDGKVLVGGDNLQFAGTDRNGLVRLNSDGSSDTAFNSGWGFPDGISDFAVQRDGGIVVGCAYFLPPSGNSVSNFLRLLPDGTIDATFSANGSIPGVATVALLPDQRIQIGGLCPADSGMREKGVGRLLTDGSFDSLFNPGIGTGGRVGSLLCLSDGSVLIAGEFTEFNGVPQRQYARLTPSGSLDTHFAVYDYSSYASGRALEVGDGRLIITGTNAVRGGHAQYGLAMYKSDVSAVPALVVPPSSQVAQPGGTVVFSVTATGDDLRYQWMRDGIDIAGETRSTLAFQNVQTGDLGRFTVRVWNALGSITSSPVEISGPNPPPEILLQPASQSIASGASGSLIVSARSAGSLTYQWRRLGHPIVGQTGATLSFDGAQMTDSGLYDVVVCDGLSRTISQAAQLLVTAPSAAAIYRMDTSFSPLFAQTGEGVVTDIAVAADRSLVVAGDFAVFMGQARENVARVNALMELDSTFHPNVDGRVERAVIQPDGKILIGGSFAHVDGAQRHGLARLNADGSLDPSFDAGTLFRYSPVTTCALQPDGMLLVGCSLSLYSESEHPGLVRLKPTGELDGEFRFDMAHAAVTAIALTSGGKIYIGGAFEWIGSSEQVSLRRLNADGTEDSSFAPVSSLEYGVSRIVVQGDEKVVVDGTLSIPSPGVVRFLPDGAIDTGFNPTAEAGAHVASLCVQADGKVLMGGTFEATLTQPRRYLVRLNADGSTDVTFSPSASLDDEVSVLIAHPDGGNLLGGSFRHVGAHDVAGLARMDNGGGVSSFASGPCGAVGRVSMALPMPDNRWLVCGNFTHVGATAASGLAIIKTDGSIDSSFNPGTGFRTVYYSTISSWVRDGEGRILIAGEFGSYNGHPSPNLVRLLPNGAWDSSFVAEWNHSNSRLSLGPQGQIYVSANRTLYRLLESGRIDPEFLADPLVASAPTTVDVQADQRIVYGFAPSARGLGRLNADGSADSTFAPGNSSDSWIYTVSAQPDGEIFVGGSFSTFAGTQTSGLVSLLGSGAVDRSFYSSRLDRASVWKTLPLSDGSMLACGNLCEEGWWVQPGRYEAAWMGISDKRFPYLSRVGRDWQLDPVAAYDVDFGSSESTEVFALGDGRLLLAGTSATRGSVRARGLVLLKPEAVSPAPAFASLSQKVVVGVGERATLSVGVSGEGAFAYQWYSGPAGDTSSPVDGATGSELVVTPGQAKSSYWVLVSNDFGAIASEAAVVTVSPTAGGDFNDDGKSDLVWTNQLTGERSIWSFNDFYSRSREWLGVVPLEWQVSATGDFNGDGKSDILWSSMSTGERVIWLMDGMSYVSTVSLGLLPSEWTVSGVADFNGDNNRDIVWRNSRSGEVALWLMNGTIYGSTVSLGASPAHSSISGVGDFNHDGSPDILWTNTATGERPLWLMSGAVHNADATLGVVDANLTISALGDYNGDGHPDLVITNRHTHERAIWLMNGITHVDTVSLGVIGAEWMLNPTASQPVVLPQPDFNADGQADILWENTTTGARYAWLMSGTAFASGVDLGTLSAEWRIGGTGDFNSDGHSDLVWENTTTGDRYVWLMNGTAWSSSVFLGNLPTQWHIAGTGDFNGDGKTDLVWENTTTGDRYLWLMDGTTWLSSVNLGNLSTQWHIVGTGDFNADGSPDLVWENTTTGDRYVWLMNGSTYISSAFIGNAPVAWHIAGAGDFNGDGQSDILWENTTTGERGMWLMSGTRFSNWASLGTIGTEWRIRN